jgi:hypothetical protein
MDGPLLQTEDLAIGVNYNFGEVTLVGKVGLGIQVTI